MKNKSDTKKNTFPSLRAIMGDRAYYITIMTFDDIKDWVLPIDKIHERKEFKTWLQRELTPKRKEEIAQYLFTQSQHFFNAIVVGIYRGDPDWYPVTFDGAPKLKTFEIDERTPNTFGFLMLSGGEEIFAIDGQHRVEGIKHALELNPELGKDQQCVIFVAHKTDEEGHKRTRRLFSTLNRYAKPVSRGEIVALSEDDSFAIVTRKLTEENPYLKNGFVAFTKETNVPPNNLECITTVLCLYEVVMTLAVPKTAVGGRERKRLEVGPPDDERLKEIYEQQYEFWETLVSKVTEIRKVISKPVDAKIAGHYRKKDGGHALFRPVGLKPFTRAVRVLMDRGFELEKAVEALSKTQLYLENDPWKGVLWEIDKQKVVTGNEPLAQNLFLYMVDQPPLSNTNDYDLLEKYQKAVGDKQANLGKIPVVKIKK